MKFSELNFESMSHGGNRAVVNFNNGYGISVIDNGYGKELGLYEIGTLYNGGLATYLHSYTGDDTVVGNLTPEEVEMIMNAVEKKSIL